MATLTDQEINNTYRGLIKTSDSQALDETGRTVLSDGAGNASSLSIGQATAAEGAKICGSLDVTKNITQPDNCTSTLGIVGICNTLNVANNTCLENGLTVTGDTLTNGNNCLGTSSSNTCILGKLTVGGNGAASTRITSVPLNSNESGLTICSANNSPYMRFCEATNAKRFSVGLDVTDQSNFKISTGNTVNGSNNFVVRASGRVNINSSTGDDNLTVGGTGLFTGNLTTNSNLNLTSGALSACNGVGCADMLLTSTGSKVKWATPGAGFLCEGTVCGTGTGTVVPKWTDCSTLTDSSISEIVVNGISDVTIDGSLTVNCNVNVNGYLKPNGAVRDCDNLPGINRQMLESTGNGIQWVTNTGTSCTGTVAGGGTINVLSKFTGPRADGGTDIGNSVIKELASAGTIGIGTTPVSNYKVKVGGSINATGGFIGDLTGNITGSTQVGNNMTALGAVKGASISNANGSAVMGSGGQITASSVTATTICATSVIRSQGDIIAYTSSDERLKDNITCIANSNNIINSLNGYCFDWNDKSVREGNSTGLIAQEVQKVLPNAVCERDDGFLAVDYIQLIPVMVEELKRLNKIVSKLES
jgi:hypothetical protein